MTTTTSTSTSTVIAAAQPMFTGPERQALAGFLAGYTGLTREAYALDLRQYASWCQQHNLPLFQARPPRPRFPRPTPNVKTSPALTSQTVIGHRASGPGSGPGLVCRYEPGRMCWFSAGPAF